MKIILNQDVYNLGEEGDVCEVANGYARNYLLPKKLAVVCNNTNLAMFKSREAQINKRKEVKRKDALSLKEKLEELELKIVMNAGESGKLFGAVTSQTIVDALAKEGVQVDKKKVDVPSHNIKMVGSYDVLIKLYEKESASVKINVVDERAEKLAAEAAEAEAAEEAAVRAAAEAEAAAEAAEEAYAEEIAEETAEAEIVEDEAAADDEQE